MKVLKKVVALVLALTMCSVLLTACSSASDAQSVAKIKENGYITMYTNAAFPPFEYVEGQNVKGVDVEIALEIAKELGVELKVENVEFASIIAGVESGKAALGIAGITVTEERKKAVDFSKDYFTSVQYIICPADKGYTTLADLAGLKIGVQLGTTGDFLVSDAINGYEDDDKNHVAGEIEGTGAEVKQYSNGIEAAQDMMNGRLDAVVLDKLPAESIVNNNADVIKCVELSGAEPESYGIAVAKGNTELLEIVNSVIDRLTAEGKIDEFVVAHSGV